MFQQFKTIIKMKTLFIITSLFFFSVCLSSQSFGATVHTGTVIETMDAGGYTYVLVEKDDTEQWVALPQSKVQTGDIISYVQGVVMNNFTSKTLDRTFETIIFSEGLSDTSKEKPVSVMGEKNLFKDALEKEQNTDQPAELAPSPGSQGAVTPFTEITVEKATTENSYTIEELFNNRKELDGKTITVRGKIIKINMNIMGKNWVHLQDGTGNPMKNSHELVLTTAETLTDGAIVTLEVKVAIDKDFGYSYKYDLLIEDTVLVK